MAPALLFALPVLILSPLASPPSCARLHISCLSAHGSPLRSQPSTNPAVTIALNKPKGVLCTHQDELGRETVYNLLEKALPSRLSGLRYASCLPYLHHASHMHHPFRPESWESHPATSSPPSPDFMHLAGSTPTQQASFSSPQVSPPFLSLIPKRDATCCRVGLNMNTNPACTEAPLVAHATHPTAKLPKTYLALAAGKISEESLEVRALPLLAASCL